MKEEKDNGKFGLHFGAICDPIAKQISGQQLKFDKSEVSHYQKDADAITRLRIRGYLPDSTLKKAQQKLFKKITKHVQEQN